MKNKTCMICKMSIVVEEQEYVEVKHYKKKDKLLSSGYYHIDCFRDRINSADSQKMMTVKAMNFLNKVERMVT